MRNRFTSLIVPLVVLALVGAGCGKKSSNEGTPSGTGAPGPTETTAALSVLKAGVLTVGSCLDYKPFEYTEGGELKGFDVELMEAVAAELGLKIEWKKA